MKNKLRVFLVPTLNTPVVYYRMGSMVPHMRKYAEVAFSYHDFQWTGGTANWERKIDEKVIAEYEDLVKCADVVVWQMIKYASGVAIIAGLKEKYPNKLFLVECDDDVFTVPAASPASKGYFAGGEIEWFVKRQIEICDGGVVSTRWLKKRFEFMGKPAVLVENSIELKKWDPPLDKKYGHKTIKIGWFGGGTHDADLRVIKNVIPAIFKKYNNVRFYIIGGVPSLFLNTKRVINKHEWHDIDKYPKAIKKYNFDIGIAPLRDSDFNRAKSNLRWLEYSAMGIPTVASNVGHFKETLKNGKTALLVTEEKEWIDALSKLIEDKEYRVNLGMRAHKELRKKWNKERMAKIYVKGLTELYKDFRSGLVKRRPCNVKLGDILTKELECEF